MCGSHCEKVAFYSSHCHSESRTDSECLSLWVCVTSNMLRPSQKPHCSVAKKVTVIRMLSAHCGRTLRVTSTPSKPSAARRWRSSYAFMRLVVEGARYSQGQRPDPCNSLMCPGCFLNFCSFHYKLLHIRARGKHLKYECKCKMHEEEETEGNLKREPELE